MILAIDIGNTQIAAGLFVDKELSAHWRLSSTAERTEDETWILMKSIVGANGFDIEKVTGVAITSVVPDITHTFEKMSDKYLKCKPVTVDWTLDLGIEIKYNTPQSVGADRLCNAVGGFFKYGGPLIIVDFGTATSFDVVSARGEYLGGMIAPGIEMSSMVLHQKAAKLPRVYLSFPEKVIGKTTETSMQSGLMYGAVEMIDGLTRRINEELGETARCIATGGLARLVINQLRNSYTLDSFLTLDGLKIIYDRVKHEPAARKKEEQQ
ncbi:type III pantothenate kinase [candidate division KSB1 bacterium]|nr:type III pantothenate kinase [candidate division KSB1 bacterium]RQW01605.1 MAG: type III pantothenate kinase [candidate division KSB1 bacterium]